MSYDLSWGLDSGNNLSSNDSKKTKVKGKSTKGFKLNYDQERFKNYFIKSRTNYDI